MAVEATAELAAEVETEGMRAQRRRGLFFVGLAAGAVGFAMTSQLALNANFVGTEMGLSGLQQGILETFRESCGIMALGLMALLTGLAEPLIGAGMLVLLGVGLSAYAFVGDYFWLIVSSLVWSQGLHTWMPLPNSMALALAEPGRAGRRLGQVTAAGAVGSATGLVVALVLHVWGGVTIRPLWLVAGAAALVGSVACLGIPRRTRTRGPRLVIRREYALYYLLSFLEGWRKQIFVAFAGFLLVKQQGTPLKTMLILWITAQGIGWIISPIVGRIIDRVGERPVLTAYYASLSLLFIGYAQIQNAYVLYGLFVADSVFFMCTMALTTYVNRIAPKSEHTATLSMGVAVNHVAAVTMPLVGGLLWDRLGYQWAFWVGATVAAASILAAVRLPGRAGVSNGCQSAAA